MKTEILKARILDLLIKGCLTSKWREEHKDIESADLLLEKIRSEKEKKLNDELVAKGKKPNAKVEIKAVSKNDEPFEIPASWRWCHLSDIVDVKGGKRIPAGRKLTDENTGYKYIRVTDMKNGTVNLDSIKYVPLDIVPIIKNYRISKNDIYITCAGTIGEVGLIPEELDDANLTENADKLILHINDKQWLFLFLSTSLIKNQISKAITTLAQPKLAIQRIQDFILPLPPLEEQKELARIANQLLAMVDEVDNSYTNLEEFSKKAKSKVLDLLIKGELTSKWREEHKDIETADLLLEKIRSEKEKKLNDELVAKGKKPNAKVEIKAVSKNDEPFEIPASWRWCRLGDISNKLIDGDHNPPSGTTEKTDYLMISSRNINHNKIVELNAVRYLTKEVFEEENKRTDLKKGDILLTTVATLGRSCIYDGKLKLTFQRSVSIIQTMVDNKFIKVVFDSPYFQQLIEREATGTAQRGFYLNQLSKTLIPLPPLNEQKELARIAETLLNQIDSLTNIDSKQKGDEYDE